MMVQSKRARLLSTTMVAGLTIAIGAGAWSKAAAQSTTDASPQADGAEAGTTIDDVVVTGSRIRRSDAASAAPVTFINPEVFEERGLVQAGDALNQVTSAVPSFGQADGIGRPAGSGQQFPNLFNLGAGRTLTLINGRRTVTTSTGLGDRIVDTNIVPVGLISRVDIIQAGGAAVYGSDAIAGVVNYVLKTDYEGLELDAQYGVSSRGDNEKPSLRLTYGKNFADGRGNIALNGEWSRTHALFDQDRPLTNLARITYTNPADGGPNDGVPALISGNNATLFPFSPNGLIFTTPAPVPQFILSKNGVYQQFDARGELTSFDTGKVVSVPFALGGDGLSYRELAALRTGVERRNFNAIGRYDLTERVKASVELLYSNTVARDPYGANGPQVSNTILNSADSGIGPIVFFANNPFLSETARAGIIAARPAFGAGSPLFLSKFWRDLLPTREVKYTTDTWRALAAIEGDFDYGGRQFYWSLSASRGETSAKKAGWGVVTDNFNRAVNAVAGPGGTPVCAVNVDAVTSNDDLACVALNIFGQGNVSAEARDYVTTASGQNYHNSQDGILATLGGDLFALPAGAAKFSLAYEYRKETARFDPFAADQAGILGSKVAVVATSGRFETNEVSAEIALPLLGDGFNLPGIKRLDFDGSYRIVDHSITGVESVWGAGLQWEIGAGLVIRGSKSRNFRSPTLDQLFAPSRTALAAILVDPCDADRINAGPSPSTRLANCKALFEANPGYGPLETFQDPSENFNNAMVTSRGNPDLKNEVSNTTTFGLVYQPTFVSGLSLIVDHISIDLENGLSAFQPLDFMATCYDSATTAASVCETFTRDDKGYIETALSTTYNAGQVAYQGEVYNLNYRFRLDDVLGGVNLGRFDLSIEVTHNRKFETSVTGFDHNRLDGSEAMPKWVGRFDARWSRDKLKLFYSVNYMPRTNVTGYSTIENSADPVLQANVRHSISGAYDFGDVTVRAGVSDLTDEMTSYPSRSFGDIAGRQYFIGLNAKF